jgi:DnaK suppressor protein
MTGSELEHFRQKLLTNRAELLAEAAVLPDAHRSGADRDGDQSDHASAETDRDIIDINRRRIDGLLGEVDHALARIASGGYGICVDTGKPIEMNRLEALPTATLSLVGQQRREQQR